MTDEIKDMFDFLLIDSNPLYSLEDCVEAIKEQRPYLDDEDSEEYIGAIEGLIERFRTGVYLCNEDELAFLQSATEMTEAKLPWKDKGMIFN